MAETTYSGWSNGWKPSGSSVYKKYRVRLDTTLNTYDTYCTISWVIYLEINSTVRHNNYHWYSSTGSSGSVNTVLDGAKLVRCGSGTTGAVSRGHTAGTISVSGSIYTSSSGGTSPWNGQTVKATKSYTVPARESYAVEYDANGGTGTITDTKWHGEDLTLSDGSAMSKSGYALLEWNTESDGSGTAYGLGDTYSANEPLSLYAIWQEKPSCSVSVSGSAPYYTGKAAYSVAITNAHVSTSLDPNTSIDSIVLTLGAQTASRTDNGSLSITPSTAGSYVPTVTITDSLGASQTYTLPAITVKQYVAPAVEYEIERTTNAGVPDEATGTSCVITAKFVFCDDAYSLQAPAVTYTGTGAAVAATVSWYTTRASDGTVSNAVTWANVRSGDTIYGLITNAFSASVSYDLSLTPGDTRASGTAKTQTLSIAYYPIDFFAEGRGVAFGQIATEDGFVCAMEATFKDEFYLHLDDTAASGVDYEIIEALTALGWDSDCLIND